MKSRKIMLVSCLTAAAMGLSAVSVSAAGYKIGFAQSYNGNSYRQTQEAQMEIVANELKEAGIIEEYTVAEANQDVATQIQQIQDFAMQGYDLIIVDPASTTSLNDAIKEVCDMGIPVFEINDGPIDLECDNLYHFYFQNQDMLYNLTKAVCEEMGGKGNLIELRGTAGTGTDDEFHAGVLKALEEYPDVQIVAEIHTDWTASKAQTELNSILPTLDTVDGLVTQGGDAYAAVQAFQSAGYDKLPVIAGDNRGSYLNWWANEAPEGYKTLSAASNPWIGALSLYVACDLLDGKEVHQNLIVDFGYVDADALPNYVGLGDDDVAFTVLSPEEIAAFEVQ